MSPKDREPSHSPRMCLTNLEAALGVAGILLLAGVALYGAAIVITTVVRAATSTG